jgi:spore coat polysaccharide biosynthesis protein SpsF (cytidylyltransferase family)
LSALAVVQARMSSTRLPGKVLADVEGEPMLALLLKRLSRASRVEHIVVATSTDAADDPIEEKVRGLGFGAHRGPRDDVLARIVGAAAGHSGAVARITGDCPLTDPAVVDEVIELFERTTGCVYASNVEPRTYPDGLDVEVVSADALEELARTATNVDDREHVTAVFRRSPNAYPSTALVRERDLGSLRWTVDTAEDLGFMRRLVGRLGPRRYVASCDEILTAIHAEPSLAALDGRRG